MSVAAGREFLAIPGPTNMPDAVLAAMHRPAVDIYSGPLVAHHRQPARRPADASSAPQGRTYIYAANGHGAWEAALTNVLSRGDKVLVLESGRFALGWGEMAKMLGVEVEVLKGDWRRAVDPTAVEARLQARQGRHHQGRCWWCRSTPPPASSTTSRRSRKAMRAARPRRAADGRPRRLARLHAVRDGRLGRRRRHGRLAEGPDDAAGPGLRRRQRRARARRTRRPDLRTLYWDWTFRDGEVHYQKYCGTPPEHLLFGLRKAIDMLFAEGLDNVFRRHRLLAEATRRAVGVWAEGQALGFNIAEPGRALRHRHGGPDAGRREPQPLLDYCRDKCGVVLGRRPRRARAARPSASPTWATSTRRWCWARSASVEMGLTALGIPHGKGGVRRRSTISAGAVAA